MVSRKVKESCKSCSLIWIIYTSIICLSCCREPLDHRFSGDEVDEVCWIISNTDQNYSCYLLEINLKVLERESLVTSSWSDLHLGCQLETNRAINYQLVRMLAGTVSTSYIIPQSHHHTIRSNLISYIIPSSPPPRHC